MDGPFKIFKICIIMTTLIFKLMLDFYVKIILPVLFSPNFLWPEKLTKKKLNNLKKLLFFYDKIDQITILPFCKMFLFFINVSFINQELMFFKIAQLFIESVSLIRENLRGVREVFFQNNPALVSVIILARGQKVASKVEKFYKRE